MTAPDRPPTVQEWARFIATIIQLVCSLVALGVAVYALSVACSIPKPYCVTHQCWEPEP